MLLMAERGTRRGQWACQIHFLTDISPMSASEIIEQIRELPANERARIAKFIADNSSPMTHHEYSIGAEGDGLPVIRANGGTITSQLVHEAESRSP